MPIFVYPAKEMEYGNDGEKGRHNLYSVAYSFSAELNRKLQISDKILRDGQKSAPPAFLNKFWQEDQYDCHLQDIAESVCTVQ